MLKWLQRGMAWLLCGIHVNRTEYRLTDGIPMVVKRRRLGGTIVIFFANRFLALSRSGSFMFVRAQEWIDWEVYCTKLLYPGRKVLTAGSGDSVQIEKVPGTSLRNLLLGSEMDLEPIVAAARELRRVHEIQCSHFQAPWSHGDMHLDNILYDSTSDRAVLIDFDTRHDSRISPPVRQADDLKVFFLELLARFNEEWAIAAAAFVNEYGAADVLAELTRQLVLPHGFAKILWDTRTFGSSHRLLERRVLELREIVHRFTINPDKAPTATSPYDVP